MPRRLNSRLAAGLKVFLIMWAAFCACASASTKTGLSACIFLLRFINSRSASSHVEGCCCTTAAIKRIPLLSRSARQKCTSMYIFDYEFFAGAKNSLLRGTSNIPVASVCTSVYRIRVKFGKSQTCYCVAPCVLLFNDFIIFFAYMPILGLWNL